MSQPNTTNKIKTPSRYNSTGIGRMLLLSLVLHVLIFVILGGFVVPHNREVKKPVYYVDLLHKPVAKPRAGRTDAVAVKKKKKPSIKKKVTKPAKPIVPKKRPKATVKKAVVKIKPPIKKVQPVKKAPVKVAPPIKQPSVTPVVTTKPPHEPIKRLKTSSQTDPMDAIDKMRRNQRISDLKNQLANLARDP